MTLCPTLGRRLLFSRRYPSPCVKLASSLPHDPAFRFRGASNSARYHDNPSSRTFPPPRDGDPDVWIGHLERYLPQPLRRTVEDLEGVGGENEEEQCQSILRLLQDAREVTCIDLLPYLAFRLNRWAAVHSIVDRLLENVDKLHVPRQVPKDLPSNIDWKALSFERLYGHAAKLIRISEEIFYEIPHVPMLTAGSQHKPAERGFLLSHRLHARKVQADTMRELWQNVGVFVLEAADLPERGSLAAMQHIYRILARFQQLDLIPHDVYSDVLPEDGPQSRSRAGMPYLQTRIMHILADASLEASYIEASDDSPSSRPPRRRFKILRRDLGVGMWLEFVLWCCIESNFTREGWWILNQMQRRSQDWHIKSWDILLQTTGRLDPRKIEYFDTWAECGRDATEERLFLSRKTFEGMGERTITSEAVVSLMDGLVDGIDPESGGDSLVEVWKKVAVLRSILKKNDLYLGPGDVNYLLSRMIESQAIVPEDDPYSLAQSLDLSPYLMAKDESKGVSNSTSKCPAVDHGHNGSALVLGLHGYALNAYASQGHILGALDIFEMFLGATDSNKVRDMRHLGVEDRYLINARAVRSTEEFQGQLLGEKGLDTIGCNAISSLIRWPVSLSLFFDTLTAARAHQLGNWLLNILDPDQNDTVVLPATMVSDPLFAPAVIRFAASTNNRNLFLLVMSGLAPPIPRETLKAMATFQVSIFEWDNAIKLFEHLPEKEGSHWGATNVADIAAAIIRFDKASASDNIHARQAIGVPHLPRAKHLLAKILKGEFNRSVGSGERPYRYQEGALYQIHRILNSLGGSLTDVCRESEMQWKHPRNPPESVPANAFHRILSAIVDTRGCLAGKRLWDLWCIDPFGAVPGHVFHSDNVTLRTGRAEDGQVDESQAGKLVLPNLKTVRIIATRAIEEQMVIWRGHSTGSSLDTAEEDVSGVLSWCIRMFEGFGLTKSEIDKELEGNLSRLTKSFPARRVH